ncbi:MAG: DUF1080 domain-containing protein [Bryobacteraceae bacterium]
MVRIAIILTAAALFAQTPKRESPQPRPVNPGDAAHPPSDAIVLFSGSDVSGWTKKDGSPTGCTADQGTMVCVSGAGDVYSRQKFQSAQIHLEFNVPHMPDQKGQLRGNSGVYLHAKYEIQILDSYHNPTYAHGSLGGLYNQAPPLVNAARQPGQWQTYDMILRAPKCDASGKVTEKAVVTVVLNGVLVQDHVAIDASEKLGAGCEPAPLMMQDHSGFPNAPVTTMRFRNIWIRPLSE